MSVTRAGARLGERRTAPAPASPLGRAGAWSYRHRRLVVLGWVVALAVVILAGRMAGSSFSGDLTGGPLSHGITVPSFGPELAALVGLGVGIDYALFVVTRYRTALRTGADPQSAVVTAMSTSGQAVVFAGSTVVLSLLGLFLLGLPFIYGAALGAIIAVLFVLTAAVTLLPAALGFVGTEIDRLRVWRRRPHQIPGSTTGFWHRWSQQVQRHPWLAAGGAVAALVLLALPFLSLRLAFTDAGTSPASYTSHQAYDLLARGFGPGTNGPLVIALDLPGAPVPGGAAPPAVSALRGQLAAQPDVASASTPQYNPARTAGVITVIPRPRLQHPPRHLSGLATIFAPPGLGSPGGLSMSPCPG